MKTPGVRHFALLFCFLFLVFIVLGIGVQRSVLAIDNYEEAMKQSLTLIKILSEIQKEYFDPEKTKTVDLIDGAIHGMVETLDRYSVYLDEDEYKEFNDQTQGMFGGLGIHIDIVNHWLTVIAPLPGTPAAKAGLMEGDRIVEIEGESTKNKNIFDAQKKLKGEAGTPVTITIARKGEKELITKTITRAIINTLAIEAEECKMLDDTVGYIRLRDFTKDAAEELEQSIRDLQMQGMRSLILDLRDNPGGLLPVAVDICDLFLDKEQAIVSQRDKNDRETFYTARRDSTGAFLLAVLVNEFTASASEIVAGCMQDHNRGIVIGPVGHKTFGKGTVQTLIDLGDSALKLTTAKYYTPKGRSIHDDEGLIPDIFAQVTDDERFNIRVAKKVGFLPPELLGKKLVKKEEPETVDDSQPVTVEEVFNDEEEEIKEEKDSLYDVELFTAYQCIKGAEVLKFGKKERENFADSRN